MEFNLLNNISHILQIKTLMTYDWHSALIFQLNYLIHEQTITHNNKRRRKHRLRQKKICHSQTIWSNFFHKDGLKFYHKFLLFFYNITLTRRSWKCPPRISPPHQMNCRRQQQNLHRFHCVGGFSALAWPFNC